MTAGPEGFFALASCKINAPPACRRTASGCANRPFKKLVELAETPVVDAGSSPDTDEVAGMTGSEEVVLVVAAGSGSDEVAVVVEASGALCSLVEAEASDDGDVSGRRAGSSAGIT